MVTIIGTYQNGYVKLDRDIASDNPLKVIVTFLEDIQALSDFSFSKSQKTWTTLKTLLAIPLLKKEEMIK